MTEDDSDVKEPHTDNHEDNGKDNIYFTEEIVIEEITIDGICGVY